MICDDTILIIYSELENQQVFSEEEPDYRTISKEFRLLEVEDARNLENNSDNKRLLE